MKKLIRLTEGDLHRIVMESAKRMINELRWETWQNAADKAHEWRKSHPYVYDRNREYDFQKKARDEFYKKHGIEDNGKRYGGEQGSITLDNSGLRKGNLRVSGHRDHDFGDDNPHNLNHNVYHLSKDYGSDGGYGRVRMYDFAHETTPEEFFGDEGMARKFRDAESDLENYQLEK